MLMKHCEHAHSIVQDREVDAVRKHSNQGATYIWLDDLILARIIRDCSDETVDFFLEAKAEVGALEFVGDGRVADVRLG